MHVGRHQAGCMHLRMCLPLHNQQLPSQTGLMWCDKGGLWTDEYPEIQIERTETQKLK